MCSAHQISHYYKEQDEDNDRLSKTAAAANLAFLGCQVAKDFERTLASAVFFYVIMKSVMKGVLAVLVLLVLAQTQPAISVTAVYNILPIKKGLTMQATVWPSYQNSWAGRFSCNNCNPFEGDTPCSKSLPLLCLSLPKTIIRPWYNIATQYTPFSVLDGGYYDGWTGGFLQITLPVQGASITSYKAGDALCKGYFGNNSQFATFDSGFYLPFMNRFPAKTWALWEWGQAKRGQWNFWGYFNHRYRGRAWVWVNGQPLGNCGN